MTDTPAVNAGYVGDHLYLFFPSDEGFHYRKQSGGVMCYQHTFQGFTYDLGRPTINRGFPDWMPRGGGIPEDETHPVADVDLSTIPEHDYETLPEWVKERGHFYNWDEFNQWLDQDDVWRHSWIDLVDELTQWNYCPDGSMPHAPDMTERWDSLDDIWAAINEVLPFEYENHERKLALDEGYEFDDFDHLDQDIPGPREGIRWITITDGPDELVGETCLLLSPNCD